MKKYKAMTVWAGASASISSVHHQPMRRVGELLAENGIKMIYGIGDEGMMGSAFQGVRNKNGKVIGITTQNLLDKQCKDKSIFYPKEITIVETLTERKHMMMDKADAILIGPGGWGTLDEITEFAVRIQTGKVEKKPLIFLNFNDFWRPMQELILNMLQEGTLNQAKVDYIDFVDFPDEIFEAIEKVQARLDANKEVGKK